MKLISIILETVSEDDPRVVANKLLGIFKETGMYAGLEGSMGARDVKAAEGILRNYFMGEYDAAVKKYGDAIESIEAETTKSGPKAAVLKINFKPGMEPKGLTAADVRGDIEGSLD